MSEANNEFKLPEPREIDTNLDQYARQAEAQAEAQNQARHLEMKNLLTAELAKDHQHQDKPAA